MPFIPLNNLDDLRIGLFVKLECSWWRHPFAKSQFKISSSKEIATILNVKNLKVLYDPEYSDPFPQEEQSEPESFSVETDLESFSSSDILPEISEESEWVSPESDIPLPPPVNKEERRDLFRQQREQFQKVENAYWQVLGESKTIFKGVSEGHRKGLAQAKSMVSHLDTILHNHNATMTLMDVVSSHGMAKGMSYHALNVCILSLITGRRFGITEEQLEPLAMAALFHDIGQRLIPMKVKFEGSGITTIADPERLSQHPQLGRDLLKRIPNVPEDSLQAVYQHHERLDGSGYPEGLTDEHISVLAKIVMVVDVYDELCNHADPQLSLTPHEALSYLYHHNENKERRKLSIQVIQSLIQSLSVYPPGTIVQLNDDRIGIVTSLNLHAQTRPLIQVYVEAMPRHEAMIIDLAEEPHLTIAKSIRPKDLSPKVLEYLSPHRMAVFIHANEHADVEERLKVEV